MFTLLDDSIAHNIHIYKHLQLLRIPPINRPHTPWPFLACCPTAPNTPPTRINHLPAACASSESVSHPASILHTSIHPIYGWVIIFYIVLCTFIAAPTMPADATHNTIVLRDGHPHDGVLAYLDADVQPAEPTFSPFEQHSSALQHNTTVPLCASPMFPAYTTWEQHHQSTTAPHWVDTNQTRHCQQCIQTLISHTHSPPHFIQPHHSPIWHCVSIIKHHQ